MNKEVLNIEGMTCNACEIKLQSKISEISGVKSAEASCEKSILTVEYEEPASLDEIKRMITDTGYYVIEKKKNNINTVCILVIILGIYVIARQLGLTTFFQQFPTVSEEKVSYAVLFVIGLLTSVHCIAMCGGINLTQSISGKEEKPLKKNILYNMGRLTGYTAVGGILGLVGEAASITLHIRGIVGIIAGVFMVLTGINMLGQFGILKKLTPKIPKRITVKAAKFSRHGSFAIGLVNAFMPCGPLQSMQLYAVACGGFLSGAFSMFFFCLGTIPLMFTFGTAAGALKKKLKTIMIKASAVLVLFLGLYMLQNNLALTGVVFPSFTTSAEENTAVTAMIDGDKQYLTTNLHVNGYDDLKVKAYIPVVWTIIVEEENLNGCNNEIILSQYDKQIKLHTGKNIIEFTPTEKGTFTYTCWMGMLKNTIIVE
ncbi:MAG: sulfite exporter TauE/SafE family protein [Clostridium sp.]|nr:sulfite exporter TauE/SafE family protein [Clostridium sp.]